MNVKIKTVFGEMSFSMAEDKALSLLGLAISYSQQDGGDVVSTERRNDALSTLPYAVEAAAKVAEASAVKKPTPTSTEKTAAKSRLEKLFGNKSEWSMPAAQPAPTTDTDTRADEEPESYKGFLYVECEKCKKVKGFCVKQPITYHNCECGHKTPLRNLIPAHVRCECESRFTYNTNLQASAFTIDCLHCGAPVDMELGAKAKAFVTVGWEGWKK